MSSLSSPTTRATVTSAATAIQSSKHRTLVTDSQRLTHPVKWRRSAVMTHRWRLVNGVELYDMTVDPGQRNNIAADHPAAVAELQQAYEAWWAKVSRQFEDEIPIVPPSHFPYDYPFILLTPHSGLCT